MTIYELRNDGKCVGRCDSRCHNATGEKCTCICCGAFHGVGTKIAIEDRNTLTDDELLETARVLYGSDKVKLTKPHLQMELFS